MNSSISMSSRVADGRTDERRVVAVACIQIVAVSAMLFATFAKLAAGREMVALVGPFNGELSIGSHSLAAIEGCVAAAALFFLGSRLAHSLLAIVFALLTLISIGLVLRGVSDCGCFGVIRTNVRGVCAFDGAVLLGLAWTFPSAPTTWQCRDLVRQSGRCGAVSLLGFLLGAAIWEACTDQTSAQAVRTIAGAPVISRGSEVTELGRVPVGKPALATFDILNTTDGTLRIVGGTNNCSVVSLCQFPVTIGPREEKKVALLVRPKGSAGEFKSRYTLYIASDAAFTSTDIFVKAHVTP